MTTRPMAPRRSSEGTEPAVTEGGADTTEAPEGTEAPTEETEAPSEGPSRRRTEGETRSCRRSPGERHVTDDEGEPVKGGTLRYGIDADTANPWAPFAASYATSGYIPLRSVSDSLFAVRRRRQSGAATCWTAPSPTTTTPCGR